MPSYVAGVFLAVSTYKGPQLAYHYFDPSLTFVNEDNELGSDNDEIEFSDDNETPPPTPLQSRDTHSYIGEDTGAGTKSSLPNDLDPNFLAELLTPPQAMCNNKFSMAVGNYNYVGIPVHILDSGTWRSVKDSYNRKDGVVTAEDSPMRLFHVCFVLTPPINEAAIAEQNIYKWILVPFVRALRNEQASKNYVWLQIKAMRRAVEDVHTPEERRQLSESESELARSLRGLCEATSNSDIARISISGHQRAFQIPKHLELQ